MIILIRTHDKIAQTFLFVSTCKTLPTLLFRGRSPATTEQVLGQPTLIKSLKYQNIVFFVLDRVGILSSVVDLFLVVWLVE